MKHKHNRRSGVGSKPMPNASSSGVVGRSPTPALPTVLPRVCLNMIVKNEAHIILECLQSIVHLVDYYVINDTGSTDNTKEVIKEFFDSKGIQGEIIDHEYRSCKCHGPEYKKYDWFHFGWNRTYAIQQCLGKSQYIMFMDADDIISGDLRFPPDLQADQYNIRFRTDDNVYYRQALIKNDRKFNWRYEDGLHEYLKGDNIHVTHTLTGDYAILSRRLGDRNLNVKKYHKDADVLAELMAENPDHLRYKYFYAQSLFNAGEFDDAIRAFDLHIQLESANKHTCNPEVVFASRIYKARAVLRQNKNRDDIIAAFMDCHKHHPDYAEPLFEICRYLNMQEDYKSAYEYGKPALDIPFNSFRMLYVDQSVYDYKLLDEMIWCATEISKYREALKWSHMLLHGGKFPPEQRTTIENNIRVIQKMLDVQNYSEIKEIKKMLNRKSGKLIGIYQSVSPFKNTYGSEIAAVHLAEELTALGHLVIIIADLVEYPYIQDDICYIPTSDAKKWHTDIFPEKFDVMIVSRFVNYFLEFDAKAMAERTYIWCHDLVFHAHWRNTQLPECSRHLVRNVEQHIDGYIVLCDWHKEHFIKTYDLPREKFHVIGNALDQKKCALVEKQKFKRVKNRFIWLASADRGLDYLIAQFPRIRNLLPDAELHIYRGEIPDATRQLASAQPYIKIFGHVSNKDTLTALAHADYWFYPTHFRETYCISALEAQRMGCACIASDLAALTSTVGDRGVLIDTLYGTDEFWFKCWSAIEELDRDTEKKEAMTAKAVEWAKTQTWEAVAKSWVELWA